MQPPVLSDPDQFPSEDIIFSHIGRANALWVLLFKYIRAEHPGFEMEWRYYRDGKSWLLKVTQKKKTIFWLSVTDGAFRTTFYFTEKAYAALMSSNISDELKQQFRSGKQYNRIRGVTVVYAHKKDIEDGKLLIEIKAGMK